MTVGLFVSVDLDNNGFICDYELNELLREAGHVQPGYVVREIIQKLDRNKDNKISFDEFLSVSEVELTNTSSSLTSFHPLFWDSLRCSLFSALPQNHLALLSETAMQSNFQQLKAHGLCRPHIYTHAYSTY